MRRQTSAGHTRWQTPGDRHQEAASRDYPSPIHAVPRWTLAGLRHCARPLHSEASIQESTGCWTSETPRISESSLALLVWPN